MKINDKNEIREKKIAKTNLLENFCSNTRIIEKLEQHNTISRIFNNVYLVYLK